MDKLTFILCITLIIYMIYNEIDKLRTVHTFKKYCNGLLERRQYGQNNVGKQYYNTAYDAERELVQNRERSSGNSMQYDGEYYSQEGRY